MHLAVVKWSVEVAFRIFDARLVRDSSLMDNRGPKRSSRICCSPVEDIERVELIGPECRSQGRLVVCSHL